MYTCTCRSPKVLSTDWFGQNTAGASAVARKVQMEPQMCFKRWASRRCWKSWIFGAAIRSQQVRGKNLMVPSGSTWSEQISEGASQREMVEGFLVFCGVHLSLLEIVRFQKHRQICEVLVWVWVDLHGFKMDCIPALLAFPTSFQQIDSAKTLQVLRRRHPRSRWSTRSFASIESVTAAGRVGFWWLFSDPNRGVAKTAWCQVAQLKEGRFQIVPRREKWLKVFLFSTAHVYLFVSVGSCWNSGAWWDLWSCRMSCSWPGWVQDGMYQDLSPSQHPFNRLILTKHCRCFYEDTQGADGAADLLEALSQSTQLEILVLFLCDQIPAGAWQKLHGAKWLNLKKADFTGCLSERNGWRFSCFLPLTCIYLSLLEVGSCWKSRACWDLWSWCMGRSWPRWVWDGMYQDLSPSQHLFNRLILTKHCRCFDRNTKGADGGADVLQALSQSPLLEALIFHGCSQIPTGAWQKLHGAKWLNLKKADFTGCLSERNGWRFSCFLRLMCIYVSLLEVVGIQEHGEICEVVVWVGVDRDGFEMECTRTCRLPNIFSTDWFWQNTAGASTETRKVQMEAQMCFKRWASRRCWKRWFSMAVLKSQQGRGKNCMVPSGSTWRRQISLGASQREMVEGFLVFYGSCVFMCLCWKLLEFKSMVRFVKLSYESELTEMGLRWNVPGLVAFPTSFNRLILTKHCRCFDRNTKGADGGADVLQALSQSPLLEELIFWCCNQIPTGAWQKVRSAKWFNLKKADFRGCLAERNGWRFSFFFSVFLSLLEVARV